MNQKLYLEKVGQLILWARSYYVNDNPLASDEEYDRLYRIVKKYENENPDKIHPDSPTQKVGGMISDSFVKKNHLTPMWSQQDIFTEDELVKWFDKISSTYGNLSYTCEPKFDGLSLNLIYDKGILVSAITRGDGKIGEDVTTNARTIKTIPIAIPYKELIEIRGEVVIHKDDFDKLNKEREEAGEELFANPRNAAAGSIRILDSSIASKRKLTFYPWGVGKNSLYESNVTEVLNLIYSFGFKENPLSYVCRDISCIKYSHRDMIKKRDKLKVGLDGMVIKVNSIDDHEEIGYTIKHPKWSCAFKFPAIEKTTKILDIITQVGRTGVITPVAILEDTLIDGSTVNRVTLHNFKEVARKDIQVNDEIILIKSGDIIPKITKIFKERRKVDNPTIPPVVCPNCKHDLIEDGSYLRCINVNCSARLKSSIAFYGSRDQLNIDGLGTAVVEDLVDNNLINNVIDLYGLTHDDLIKLDGYKETKINNLLEAIENSKGSELYKLIAALGIPTVGRTISKKLQDIYGMGMLELSKEELLAVDGIGEEITNNYMSFFTNNSDFIRDIVNLVEPIIPEKVVSDSVFNNKVVVLSGTMPGGKGDITDTITALGGTVKGSITKDTDYLISSEESGTKYDKAIELDIPVLSYDKYLKMI
jgi:DNA ligase (NAD+)